MFVINFHKINLTTFDIVFCFLANIIFIENYNLWRTQYDAQCDIYKIIWMNSDIRRKQIFKIGLSVLLIVISNSENINSHWILFYHAILTSIKYSLYLLK